MAHVKPTHPASLTSSSDNSVIWASFLLGGYSDFHPVPGETLTPLKEQAISTGQLGELSREGTGLEQGRGCTEDQLRPSWLCCLGQVI